MTARKAVLLDTSVIGRNISLDDIVKDKNKDYFITNGVLRELKQWGKKGGKRYKSEKDNIDVKIKEAQKSASNQNYITITEFVEVRESELKELGIKRHDPYVARLFYEGFVKSLQINFKQHKGPLRRYFLEIQKNYQDVLDAKGLCMEVTQNGAWIPKKEVKKSKKHRTVNLRSKKDLNKHFIEYSKIGEAYTRELKQLDQRYETFHKAMDVLTHFKLHQDKLVISERTEPRIASYGKLTAKSIAKEVYNEYYKGRGLEYRDIGPFIRDVNRVLRAVLSSIGYWDSSLNEILDRAVNQTRAYIKRMIKHNDGYIPENNTNVDSNMVSVGRNFASIKTGYSEVGIMTRDSDIDLMVRLCNKDYRPTNISLSCRHIRE